MADTGSGALSLESLVAQQEDLIHRIGRALDNFKKVGRANLTLGIVRNRLACLKEDFATCQARHSAIIATASPPEKKTLPYFVEQRFLQCEEIFLTPTDYMSEALIPFEPVGHSSPTDASVTFHPPEPPIDASPLPPISLPKFSGTIQEWESFREIFTATVINQTRISASRRLQHLSSCLVGEARTVVQNLAITDANFAIAWDLLKDRYENTRRLVNAHVADLMELPTVAEESATDLQRLRGQARPATLVLKNLKRPVRHWDDLLVYLIAARLDKATRKAWEFSLSATTDCPTYNDIDAFLESRIRGLQAIPLVANLNSQRSGLVVHRRYPRMPPHHRCPALVEKPVAQRLQYIRSERRCLNCFSRQHAARDCSSQFRCRLCQRKHHTLLHQEPSADRPSTASPPTDNAPPGNPAVVSSHTTAGAQSPHPAVLLTTAWVQVNTTNGRRAKVRALLDSGSAATLVTQALATRLRAHRSRISVPLALTNDHLTTAKHAVRLTVTPVDRGTPSYATTALVLPALTSYVPPRTFHHATWNHLRGLPLADPNPSSSDQIDIIIGSDLYGALLREGLRQGTSSEPIAQNRIFGWILSGPIPSSVSSSSPLACHHSSLSSTLDEQLRRFWEIEELPRRTHLTSDEVKCEEHFLTTHSRTPNGRYVVRLPFATGPPIDVGQSKALALSMLLREEKRLLSHPAQRAEYVGFMEEYESLNHMALVPESEPATKQSVYFPHHPVLRDTSTTTRLRVVFNASSPTSTGASLNDFLLPGPKLQNDLPSVLMQWRQHRYVYCADIAKMYRQILIDPRDAEYQRILWRSDPSAPVQSYRLLTLTYGTASAPYLAFRVLRQLATDEGSSYPLAVRILRRNMYVDDCLFGADTLALARTMRDQVNAILARAGFTLRKWASNSNTLLRDIDARNHGLAQEKPLIPDGSLPILGISWNPARDEFRISVTSVSISSRTKRSILSLVARIFDPLGWVSPVIITAKVLMQQLWRRQYDWDTSLPSDILDVWQAYQQDLPLLASLAIPRWTHASSNVTTLSLHGFADASTVAYAAVVYLLTTSPTGTIQSTLLGAKSRVAPVKTVSVPRLELWAAVLLTHLISFVRTSLEYSSVPCHCWTDSTITLAWLSTSPASWKTFVANRVAEIQTQLPFAQWRHVSTLENPADCASRGQSAPTFLQNERWWHGPSWLRSPPASWPSSISPSPVDSTAEAKSPVPVHTLQPAPRWDLAHRFSSWSKLLRVTAYIFRFIHFCRPRPSTKPLVLFRSVALQANEVEKARVFWLKNIQRDLFPAEIHALSRNTALNSKSRLLSLAPFLDANGLIRVGGRLRRAELPEHTKHPILLGTHHLVELIITHVHLRAMHSGPQLTLGLLREEFWLLRARPVVRAVLYWCVPCARAQAAVPSELMGDLPSARVNPSSRAFLHTGLDYAGPVLVRTSSGRGHRSQKGYIALLVCLATRAIYLDLAPDYSSAAFLRVFARFSSIYGLPSDLYSDNGTTFQGADRELTLAFREATRASNTLNQLATDRVTWHFIPPSAPHFGGLWEAGIRSAKHHLKRVIGVNTYTFEELSTLLHQVAACLNSRPIAPVSDNLGDYHALTPGHFLTGSAITAIPSPSLLDEKGTRLARWQQIRQKTESFWQAWARDYLQTLQQRPKWRTVRSLAKVGRLVLLRHPNLPPCKWELGRITECHPGEDGLTRVVTVKTASSEYKRPIVKLCFLPAEINEAASAGGDTP